MTPSANVTFRNAPPSVHHDECLGESIFGEGNLIQFFEDHDDDHAAAFDEVANNLNTVSNDDENDLISPSRRLFETPTSSPTAPPPAPTRELDGPASVMSVPVLPSTMTPVCSPNQMVAPMMMVQLCKLLANLPRLPLPYHLPWLRLWSTHQTATTKMVQQKSKD